MHCLSRTPNPTDTRRAGLLLALSLAASCAMAASGPEPTARELHTADCIAALERRSEDLAQQVKAGQSEQRAALQGTLDAAAAFIGHAYLQGDRDQERLEKLKDAALQAHKTLTGAELATRQNSCTQEGGRLLAEADIIARFVVSRLAARQMKRLLGD